MGRILFMVFLKQKQIADEGLCTFGWRIEAASPLVETTPADTDVMAKKLYIKLIGEFINYFEFVLLKRMNSLFAPSPFTM